MRRRGRRPTAKNSNHEKPIIFVFPEVSYPQGAQLRNTPSGSGVKKHTKETRTPCIHHDCKSKLTKDEQTMHSGFPVVRQRANLSTN